MQFKFKPVRDCRGEVIGAVLAAALLVAGIGPAQAGAVRLGAGVFGVYGIPVVQEDVGGGPLFGLKAKADLAGPLGAEVFYLRFQEGDVKFTVPLGEQTIKGGTQSAFGVNAVLGTTGASGFGLYLTAGIGSYSLEKDNRDSLTRMGYNGGLGMEFRSTGGIGIDLSGRLHAVPLEDGGARKFAALQVGINYYFVR